MSVKVKQAGMIKFLECLITLLNKIDTQITERHEDGAEHWGEIEIKMFANIFVRNCKLLSFKNASRMFC